VSLQIAQGPGAGHPNDRGASRVTQRRGGQSMMKSRLLSGVVGLSMLTLAAAGCGTVGGAAVGAGAGAAVGAGTGYGAGKGALIGTGVGAAAGAIYDITKKN
jgi:hypothetical protein